jgi:pyridoxal/pyridoxine/pyridoxamine kinase
VRESLRVSAWEGLVQQSEIKVAKEEWKDRAIRYFTYQDEKDFEIIHCRAFPYDKEEIVDTTGAGDVFVGTLCAAFLEQKQEVLDVESMLGVATLRAGAKCSVK